MPYKIYLSPSDQNANAYAFGDTNERVQCCRIALAAHEALERCGFVVRTNQFGTMEYRVAESNSWGADLHVPIHTNAFNGEVSGTRMFYLNEQSKGKDACLAIFNRLAPVTPGASESIRAYPELYELKATTAVAAYIECEFHDVPEVAKWIIEHVTDIGEAICAGICDYFGVDYIAAGASDSAPETDPNEPEWSRKEGWWAKATAAGIIDGMRAEAPVKRDEMIAVLGRLGLIK